MALLILANAVFVAGEFSLLAVDPAQAQSAATDRRRGARTLLALKRHQSFHLSAAQLGITLSSLLLGVIAEPAVGGLLTPGLEAVGIDNAEGSTVSAILVLLIAAGTQMVVGELVPKGIAVSAPLTTALWLAPFQRGFVIVTGPLVRLLDNTANRMVRRLGVKVDDSEIRSMTVDEYQMVLDASVDTGQIGEQLGDLLQRTLLFGEKSAASVMTPRTSLVSLSRDATLNDLRDLCVSTGRSRIIVEDESLDDILGVIHVAEIFGFGAEQRGDVKVENLVRDAFVAPESRDLGSLLGDLRESGNHLALIVDEYGGTAGIVTLEDLLEEIVGEIHDEHDVVPDLTAPLARGIRRVDGSLHRGELEDLVGLKLPEGEFETLAGFLLVLFERIPEVGEIVDIDGWHFEILALDRHRISEVGIRSEHSASRIV